MDQTCSCCEVSKAPSQFKKFSTCKTKPCNTTCNFCWTQYLKTDFMENPAKELACLDCNEPLDKDKNLQLLMKSPEDREHYEYCLKRFLARRNGDVACIFAECQNVQVQFVEGSRLSTCVSCTRQACIPCDGPEHLGETCEQYQSRITSEHTHENSATAQALEQGYSGQEEVGIHGKVQMRPKRPLPCPSCGVWVERYGGCLRLRCPVCSLDFCGKCAAPYLGKNSVPIKGNKTHHDTCPYFSRKLEDRRLKPDVKRKAGFDSGSGSASSADESREHSGDGGVREH